MVVREAREDDLEAVADVIYAGQSDWPQRETREEVRRRVLSRREHKRLLLAEEDGKIVATAFYFPETQSVSPRKEAGAEDAHLGGFYLLPDRFDGRFASRFAEEVLRRIKEDGYEHVRMWAPADRAHNFYQKEGWVRSGRTIEHMGMERVEYLLPLDKS